MGVMRWCTLGGTLLLLVCEVTISQLCKSSITLVDGFHTLFILMHMALPPPLPRPNKGRLFSPSLSPAPPDTPKSSALRDSPILDKRSSPRPPREATSPDLLSSSSRPLPAPDCVLPHMDSRTPAMGAFISALILASLCVSFLMEVMGLLEPPSLQRPLLLVTAGVVSLLHNLLVLRLSWDRRPRGSGAEISGETDAGFYLEVNRKALAEEETRSRTEPERVSQVQSAVDVSVHNGALVLCNPATSSIPDSDPAEADAQASRHGDVQELTARGSDVNPEEYLESQKAPRSPSTSESSRDPGSPSASVWWRRCLSSCVRVIQGLLTPALVLINSLVLLLITPPGIHGQQPCFLLVYLDQAFSILAVIVLIARATPQVRRYGLLLMQATPPHICVSELGQRIANVPGVQGVHDLHIWELADSLIVASVHVHCHAGFPVHRCADVMSGVTKVLKSVGVSCCTVQPEFVGASASSAGGQDVLGQLPPMTCSFSCGKACAAKMCCTTAGDEHPGQSKETRAP